MKKTITSEIVVGYSQCPYKAYLLLCTKERGSQHEYMQILEKQQQTTQRKYIDELREANVDVQPYSLNNLTENHKYLINATLEVDGYSANCAALTKVRTHSAFGHYSYEPTIVVGAHTIKKEHRLELFFVSYVLERVQEKCPVSGYIVGLDGKSHRVKLENGSKTLIPFLEPLQEWVAEETPEPPSLILNKNCPACQFRDLCREKAVQEDNLSLLDGISTQKAINKYEKKGLFTVKQLSYTFKPRKRRKRVKNPPPVIHKPELQALAIREQKIYLQELPELTRQPVELFLDIEGIPDQQFYYLIGLLVSEKGNTTYHPFWADTTDDEAQIWRQFLEKVNQYPDAPIYHYGSFEPRTLTKLGNRYETKIDGLINRLVNVNKHIYGKVYFPVYSNRLKEIGAFIGASWTFPNASGLQSLVWRQHWDETYNIEYKDVLLTYNQEDCQALKLLTNECSKIKCSAATLSKVDFADERKQQTTEISEELHSQFDTILKFSYFGYDSKKIVFNQDNNNEKSEEDKREQKRHGARKLYQKLTNIKHKSKKIIQVSPRQVCPQCGYKPLGQTKLESSRLIIDLVLTRNGVKKTITEYVGSYARCPICERTFIPPANDKFKKSQLYGYGLAAWVVYHRVALRLPYESIRESLSEQFDEKISAGRFPKFIRDCADYYVDTERFITQRLLKSTFIHADETKFNIQGANWYVWVFTNEEYVFFRLSETREATFLHDFFAGYNGVLISDFYAGYDSVQCKQQKCWVHLIRELNNDLRESPFDKEYENFIVEVRDFIIPIMEAIQKYGLKKRNLNKFKRQVYSFYSKTILGKRYKSELIIKYQKRFIRYRESLFTFLERDGIPWHNNTAERAIRPVAKQRAISTFFYEAPARHYLLLLSIRQTCRFQGKSFFKFLFSGEKNLDKFEVHKRKRHV